MKGYDQTGNWDDVDCSETLRIKHISDYVRLRVLLQVIGCECAKFVVEAGCGAGKMTEVLINRGYKVAAIDRDPVMLRLAEEHTPSLKQYLVDFILDDVTQSSFLKKIFFTGKADVVVANVVLMHNSRAAVKRFFRNAYTLLKPGGKVVVSVSPHQDLLRISTVEKNSFIVYRLANGERIKNSDISELMSGKIKCQESYRVAQNGKSQAPKIWVHTGKFLRQAAKGAGFGGVEEDHVVITEDMLAATGFSPTLPVAGYSAYVIVSAKKPKD